MILIPATTPNSCNMALWSMQYRKTDTLRYYRTVLPPRLIISTNALCFFRVMKHLHCYIRRTIFIEWNKYNWVCSITTINGGIAHWAMWSYSIQPLHSAQAPQYTHTTTVSDNTVALIPGKDQSNITADNRWALQQNNCISLATFVARLVYQRNRRNAFPTSCLPKQSRLIPAAITSFLFLNWAHPINADPIRYVDVTVVQQSLVKRQIAENSSCTIQCRAAIMQSFKTGITFNFSVRYLLPGYWQQAH